jgi:CRISPR/Cas system CMR-associated protein Cmr5 small subunit
MHSIDNISEELNSLSQHVAQLPKNTLFTVPVGYFDNFPARLMDAIQNEASEEELFELSPLLKTLKHENPYTLPDGYFNHLKVEIPKHKAPVVGMYTIRSWAKYAAAACLLGIIATVFFVSKTENETSLALQPKETESLQNKVSPDAIAMYLEEMDNLSVAETTENEQVETESNLLVDMSSETIEEILQEIPDKDISLYMDQDGLGDVHSLN